MRILKFFTIFIFLNTPLIRALNKKCPSSYCGKLPINYPFILQGQHPKVCSNYFINITCTSQNNTILNIPFSGDFHVTDIYYYSRSVILSDPENCLAKRLINLNLSSSHFSAVYYQTFTFYSCFFNKLLYGGDLTVIDCLSNYPNVTVATSYILPAEEKRNCSKMFTKEMPVAQFDHFSYLKLTWDVPSCIDCDDFHVQSQDNYKSQSSKLITIVILIPLGITVTFLAISIMANQRTQDSTAARTTTGEADLARQTTTNAAAMQPPMVSDGDMTGPDGQSSYLQTMKVSAFLEGNYGSLEGHDQGTSCTICLEEYIPTDVIRFLTSCHHYYHAKCIDQWFQGHNSCPVCRTSIFNV